MSPHTGKVFLCIIIYTSNYAGTNDIISSPIAQPPPAAPSGVMVDSVDDSSVRVVWQTVDDADRYTVTFSQTMGHNQQGLCKMATHTLTVSVDVPSASIGVGQMLAGDYTTMLKAYTTYSITVIAESDVTGSSEGSEPVTVTTAQTSKC